MEVELLVRAVVLKRAGSPGGLSLVDVPTPAPGPGEVLVRINATTVTRGDVVMRKMPRLLARLLGEKPKSILGHEFAGDVEAVGAGVTTFAAGDRVFGTTTDLGQGSHAEYITAPARGLLATIPEGIHYEDAAPVPIGAMTALHFLEAGGLAPGQSVLINGASGSVGSYAVQIAKTKGAHVTGVASSSNLRLVADLGADEVIDYRIEDFTQGTKRYDLIFDAAGKTTGKRAERVLTESGEFVTTQKRRTETIEEFGVIRELLALGSIRAVVDRFYTLDEIRDAHNYVDQGHKQGNVIVTIPR